MSMKKSLKIDKFYLIMGAVLLVLALLVIMVLRGIFFAVTVSREIDAEYLEANSPRLDKAKLDEAYERLSQPDVTVLDLGE